MELFYEWVEMLVERGTHDFNSSKSSIPSTMSSKNWNVTIFSPCLQWDSSYSQTDRLRFDAVTSKAERSSEDQPSVYMSETPSLIISLHWTCILVSWASSGKNDHLSEYARSKGRLHPGLFSSFALSFPIAQCEAILRLHVKSLRVRRSSLSWWARDWLFEHWAGLLYNRVEQLFWKI